MLKKITLLFAAAMTVLSGCSEDSDQIPTQEVKKLRSDLRGHEVPEGVMLSKHFKPFWKEHVVVGYPKKPHEYFPQKLVELEQAKSCKLNRPEAYEVVSTVSIGHGKNPTNIYSWNRKELEKATKKFVEHYSKSGEKAARKRTILGRNLTLVNLYLTDQSAPNHLVLSSVGNVLWNIHVGELVTISNITLISSGTAGIVNVPGNVKVQSMAGEKASRCGVSVARKPNDTWRFYQNYLKSKSSHERVMEENLVRYAKFNNWYRNIFDAKAENANVKALSVSNILIGPLPKSLDKRLKYKSIQGSVAYLVGGRSAIMADKKQYREFKEQTVLASVKKLVGDDLTVLEPGS